MIQEGNQEMLEEFEPHLEDVHVNIMVLCPRLEQSNTKKKG
jgi:hypothetical protein